MEYKCKVVIISPFSVFATTIIIYRLLGKNGCFSSWCRTFMLHLLLFCFLSLQLNSVFLKKKQGRGGGGGYIAFLLHQLHEKCCQSDASFYHLMSLYFPGWLMGEKPSHYIASRRRHHLEACF